MENVRADVLANFTLPSIRNHVDPHVEERAPWEGISSVPGAGLTKKQVSAWNANNQTQHLFYSPYEANNPNGRLSKTNPPRLLRAIAVDYDNELITDEWIDSALAKTGFPPNWIERSYSGGVHAIWALEESVWVMNPDFRKQILGWFKKKLKLDKFLPGMDAKVYADGMLYISCGTAWEKIHDGVISSDLISQCLLDCGTKANFGDRENPTIPLEKVKDEIDARWPGRWHGDFEVDSRGTRFWEDGADAMSVIVKPEGLLCYTGDQGFLPWGQLLGREFVEQYETERIGRAARCAWFDGREFWVQDMTNSDSPSWTPIAREDLARKLKVEFHMSAMVAKGCTASEVDEVIHAITVTRRVRSAGPFIPYKPGIVMLRDGRHLNTANCKACEPASEGCTPEDFPWLFNFFQYAFTLNAPGEGMDEQEQLLRFLAWFQRAYVSMLNYMPSQSQILVLAGEVGCGKTLLTEKIIGPAMGGQKDASAYYLDESKFNKALYHTPLWMINDSNAADPSKRNKFNSMLKRASANNSFEMQGKFQDQKDVLWTGRTIITCNVDSESIQVMPQLDMSMEDKIMALRFWGGDRGMGIEEVNSLKRFGVTEGKTPDKHIESELPSFLSWLLAWEVPSWIKRDPRFGYESHHHQELKDQAASSSPNAAFDELLHLFLTGYFKSNPKEHSWEGSASRLRIDMGGAMEFVLREFSTQRIAKILSNMSAWHKCGRRILDGYAIYLFDNPLNPPKRD